MIMIRIPQRDRDPAVLGTYAAGSRLHASVTRKSGPETRLDLWKY